MIFSFSIGLYPGHAPANFAYASVLSEKLHFTRFSQVPAGSDYPCYSPMRQENILLFYKLFSSIKKDDKGKLICLLFRRKSMPRCRGRYGRQWCRQSQRSQSSPSDSVPESSPLSFPHPQGRRNDREIPSPLP